MAMLLRKLPVKVRLKHPKSIRYCANGGLKCVETDPCQNPHFEALTCLATRYLRHFKVVRKVASKMQQAKKAEFMTLFNPPTRLEHGPTPHTPLGAGQREP